MPPFAPFIFHSFILFHSATFYFLFLFILARALGRTERRIATHSFIIIFLFILIYSRSWIHSDLFWNLDNTTTEYTGLLFILYSFDSGLFSFILVRFFILIYSGMKPLPHVIHRIATQHSACSSFPFIFILRFCTTHCRSDECNL